MNCRQIIQRKGAKTQRRKGKGVFAFRQLSLAPGLSPVFARQTSQSRFNGFATARASSQAVETVETVFPFRRSHTRLKPGANERRIFLCVSAPLRLCAFALNFF